VESPEFHKTQTTAAPSAPPAEAREFSARMQVPLGEVGPRSPSIEYTLGGLQTSCSGTTAYETACSTALRDYASSHGGTCHTPGNPSGSSATYFTETLVLNGHVVNTGTWFELACTAGTMAGVNATNLSWENGDFQFGSTTGGFNNEVYTSSTAQYGWWITDFCGTGSAGYWAWNGASWVFQGCQSTDEWVGWAYASPCQITPQTGAATSYSQCSGYAASGEELDQYDPTGCGHSCAQ
jgi:hypothetical protein